VNQPLLSLTNVTKRLGPRRVLDGLSMQVESGEACALVGPNGAGKSTLLRVVAGVLDPDSGSVCIAGLRLERERAHALAELGYAPERCDVPEHLRATEWLALVSSLRRVPRPDAEFLDRFELAGFAHARVATLSLGQRRRLSLAAALLGAPRLLVLDEPTNGLDAASLDALSATVSRHTAEGGAVLVATHDRAWAAARGCRIACLEGGAIGAAA
jgi:heme ABC exporter ATP-binding subunit CcmA